MHIWNMTILAKELRDDKLTETQAFQYFLVVAILSSVSWFLAWLFGLGTPLTAIPFGFVFPVVCLAITVVGLIACFRSFQQRGSHQFIQKFICLLLPASIRIAVYCLPLYVVASFIALQFPPEQRHNVIVTANALIVTIMMAVQFLLVYRHLVGLPGAAPSHERAAT